MSLRYTEIEIGTLAAIGSRYDDVVPPNLTDLDDMRYRGVPGKAYDRKVDVGHGGKGPWLTKGELETLVEWKLKHGTYRPKLLQLVQSNSEKAVEETTREAYELVASEHKSPETLKALKVLTSLKGIGPATASLILSVCRESAIPFFSDELFRWVMWDEKGKPDGWKRIIKYNMKEYEELLYRVAEIRERLGVGYMLVERFAWVLGKEGWNVGKDEAEVEKDEEGRWRLKGRLTGDVQSKTTPGRTQDVKHESGKSDGGKANGSKAKKGAKRKAVEEKPLAEGVRRSSRMKTNS